jgi:hypothetical protein
MNMNVILNTISVNIIETTYLGSNSNLKLVRLNEEQKHCKRTERAPGQDSRMMNAKPGSRAHFRSIKFIFFSIAHQIYRASMALRLRNAPSVLSRPLNVNSFSHCPSCAIWRRALSTRNIDKTNTLRRTARPHNTITASGPREFTSSSVITAKSVPPRFKELHAALEGVKDAALEQVNLSRLQLALRGLESETPLVRVAGELLFER